MFPEYSTFKTYCCLHNGYATLGDTTNLPIEGIGTSIYILNGKTILTHNALHITALCCLLTFILILNLHLLKYYVPSRAYAREPLFNHFDSTFSCIPAQPSKFPVFLQTWQQNKWKFTAPISTLRYPTSPPPQHCTPTPLSIIACQGKRCAILRPLTPLEDIPIKLVYVELFSVVIIVLVPCATPNLSPAGRWS